MIRRTFMQLVASVFGAGLFRYTKQPFGQTPREIVLRGEVAGEFVTRCMHAVFTRNKTESCGFAAGSMMLAEWSVTHVGSGKYSATVRLVPYQPPKVLTATGEAIDIECWCPESDWPSFDGFVEVRGA